mmetsp:Transcript_54718/g.177779  ORF Transcript_54718/g.177779 Transcript_54718/m.177779 type:complete len:90 (+) Transcript_54718:187-456(+)
MEEDPEESQSNKADALMGSVVEVEQYCIQVVAMGGASFTVGGVSASDSVRDLLARVSSLAGVPPSELRLGPVQTDSSKRGQLLRKGTFF